MRIIMVMMLLKTFYNLSEEGVVARWQEYPFMQFILRRR